MNKKDLNGMAAALLQQRQNGSAQHVGCVSGGDDDRDPRRSDFRTGRKGQDRPDAPETSMQEKEIEPNQKAQGSGDSEHLNSIVRLHRLPAVALSAPAPGLVPRPSCSAPCGVVQFGLWWPCGTAPPGSVGLQKHTRGRLFP